MAGQTFITEAPDYWEVLPAVKAVANLQSQQDPEKAVKMMDDLGKKLSKEAKADLDYQAIGILFAGGKFPLVQTRATALNGALPAGDPIKEKLKFYDIGCKLATGKVEDVVAELQAAILKTNDPIQRAAGYNVLGDCYMTKAMPRDAMWAYLWVDVVYPIDRGEQLRALEHLARLFENEPLKDEGKAKLYRDKIQRLR